MRLPQLIKPLDQQSDDELMERLRTIRYNREVIRPAAKRIVQKAKTKASRGRVSSVEKLLEGLSESEREALLKQLSLDLEPGESGNE